MRKGTFTTCVVVVIIKKGYDQNFQFLLSNILKSPIRKSVEMRFSNKFPHYARTYCNKII